MANKKPVQRPVVMLEPIPEPDHPTKRSKIANWIILGALIIATIAILVMLAWSFDNEPVLRVKNSPFPIRSIREHPTAGGVVIIDADYCKDKKVTGQSRISFVSETREYFLPESKEEGPTGCQHQEVPIIIPKDIAPGMYKLKFRITYDKNPLKQNEVVEFESQPVTINPTP